MKQAYKTNFEGFEFFIDEDARLVFFEFLENMEQRFKQNPSDTEQWKSFKTGLKERLRKEIRDESQVLTLKVLEGMISDISADYKTQNTMYSQFQRKKLFRDTENAVLGGVCSGIANYTQLDLALVRILAIISLFSGVAIIIYLVLWIVIPPFPFKQPINANNKSGGIELSNPINAFFSGIGHLLSVIFKGIGSLLGLVFIIIGIVLLLGFFKLLPWNALPNIFDTHWDVHWNHFYWNNLNQDKLLFLICMAFLIAIPVIAVIYRIFAGLFNFGRHKKLRVATFFLWFLCLFGAIATAISFKDITSNSNAIVQRNTLNNIHSNTIYIEKTDHAHPEMKYVQTQKTMFNYGYAHLNGQKFLYGSPKIKIVRSTNNVQQITINKNVNFGNSSGYENYNNANISYYWEQNDSLLLLDRHFYSSEKNWWHFPHVEIEIVLPQYKNIMYVNPDAEDVF